VNVIIERRDVLRTLAVSAATSAVGLASARAESAIVANETVQTHLGVTVLTH
jgi:hypothetical protein